VTKLTCCVRLSCWSSVTKKSRTVSKKATWGKVSAVYEDLYQPAGWWLLFLFCKRLRHWCVQTSYCKNKVQVLLILCLYCMYLWFKTHFIRVDHIDWYGQCDPLCCAVISIIIWLYRYCRQPAILAALHPGGWSCVPLLPYWWSLESDWRLPFSSCKQLMACEHWCSDDFCSFFKCWIVWTNLLQIHLCRNFLRYFMFVEIWFYFFQQTQTVKGEKSSTDVVNTMLKKYPQPKH